MILEAVRLKLEGISLIWRSERKFRLWQGSATQPTNISQNHSKLSVWDEAKVDLHSSGYETITETEHREND